MTTPRPPSIETRIISEPFAPAYHTDDVVYIVGPPGAGATGTATDDPSHAGRTLASLEDFIGTDGIVHDAVDDIADQIDTNIIVALTPAVPTFAEVITALEKAYQAERNPTILYAPGMTHLGTPLGGGLAAAMDDVTTSLTFTTAPDPALSADLLLQVDNEIMIVDVAGDAGDVIYVVRRGEEGTDAVMHLLAAVVTDLRNPVVTELEELAEALECNAIADAPFASISAAIAWADAGNVKANVMGVFNRINGTRWPGGAWLGGALEVTGENGRQRGIEHARVSGITSLQYNLSHSPRLSVTTDVSRLVGAYLSTLVFRNGHYEIVGDTFKGVADARKHWSTSRVVHHLEHVLEIQGEHYTGQGITRQRLITIAEGLEKAGRILVTNGELAGLSIIPDPVANTPAAREGGFAHFTADATTIVPLDHIRIDLALKV